MNVLRETARGLKGTAAVFCVMGLLFTASAAAQSISEQNIGQDGSAGGSSGSATGAPGIGGNATGRNDTAGNGQTASGGSATGGEGTGGSATSGDARGGAGENGAAFSIETERNLSTSGDDAAAISVRSGGGAGGTGGTSGNADGGNGTGGGATGGNASAGTGGSAFGGNGTGGSGTGGSARSGNASGGAGGNGGRISIESHGKLTTSGDGSFGISAVSTGGAGGTGGSSGTAAGGSGTGGNGSGGNALVGAGGSARGGNGSGGDGSGGTAVSGDAAGGTGGRGGAISIINRGTIDTTGVGADGIHAVSTGAAGGLGGASGAATGGSGTAGAGTGGTAAGGSGPIDGTGENGIATNGAATQGSATAGANGTGGRITVENSGDVTARGRDSNGIFARSVGGDVAVVLSGGRVTGGAGSGAGIALDGSDALLTVRASAALDAFSDLAVRTTGGSGTVDNFGLIDGDVVMGGTANRFDNQAGGIFQSGTTVDLSGGVLTNAGTLSPGGTGNITTTSLAGTFVQQTGGVFFTDANFATNLSDRLDIQATTTLGGLARVNLLSLDGDGQDVTVLTSAGGISLSGFTVLDTPVVGYSFRDQNDAITLTLDSIDFAASGLGHNQTSVSRNLEAIFSVGPGALDPTLLALANLPTLNQYAGALDHLSPEPYLAVPEGDWRAAERFADAMLTGCSAGFRVGGDAERCAWARVQGNFFDQDGGSDRIGIRENGGSIMTGIEASLDPVWTLGGAIAYDFGSISVDDRADISANRIEGGLSLKREEGRFLLGFGVFGGYGWLDATRFIDLPGSADADADFNSAFVGGVFRAGYTFSVEDWNVMPRVDIDVAHLHMDGFRESGAGALDLITGSVNKTIYGFRPGVDFSTEIDLANGAAVHPHIAAGLAWTPDPDFAVSASFEGAPAGIPAFGIESRTDELTGELGIGADITGWRNVTLGARYGLSIGETTLEQTAALKLDYRF